MALQFPKLTGGAGAAGTDDDAIHDNVPAEITAVAEKLVPATGDFLLIEDGADLDNKKKVDIGNLPAGAPAAHALGGAQHTVDTLANLNSKVSDATLIDTGDARLSDARTPTAHALAGAEHTVSTLAALNTKVSDATLIDTTDARLSDNRTDADAIHDNVAGEINAIVEKLVPATGDLLIIEDGADTNNKKKIDIGNLPAGAPAAHALGGAQHTTDTLVNLNSKVSDATLIDTGDSRLSDARTPTTHALAGAEHSTSTLAALNTKVSDATLIDTGDSRLSDARTPTSHAFAGAEHSVSNLAAVNTKISDATLIDTGDARLSDDRTADEIRTATTVVGVSGAAAPSAGQVLTATSSTAANWQTPAAGGGGDQLDKFNSNDASFPATAPAAASSRNEHPVVNYDDTTPENIVFNSLMSNDYLDGSLTVDIDWVALTAVVGDVVWGVEVEAVAPGGQDIDADGFAAQQTGTNTTSGTSGIVTRTSIALTQAQADSIAAGQVYRLRVQRVAGAGGDTLVGDAQLLRVALRQ